MRYILQLYLANHHTWTTSPRTQIICTYKSPTWYSVGHSHSPGFWAPGIQVIKVGGMFTTCRVQFSSDHFMCFTWFHVHSNLIIPFYRWGTEQLNTFPKVTQLEFKSSSISRVCATPLGPQSPAEETNPTAAGCGSTARTCHRSSSLTLKGEFYQ